MDTRPLLRSAPPATARRCSRCALLLGCLALAGGARADGGAATRRVAERDPGAKPTDSATLEQCVDLGRAGGTLGHVRGRNDRDRRAARRWRCGSTCSRAHARRSRLSHASPRPARRVAQLGPGVKIYKYLKQVTNLAAPASYRAAVRFRWLNAKGRADQERRTAHADCEQPLTPRPETTPTETGTAQSGSPPLATERDVARGCARPPRVARERAPAR